jgi:hypothetical protein
MAPEKRLAAAFAHIQLIRKDFGFGDSNLVKPGTNRLLEIYRATVGQYVHIQKR